MLVLIHCGAGLSKRIPAVLDESIHMSYFQVHINSGCVDGQRCSLCAQPCSAVTGHAIALDAARGAFDWVRLSCREAGTARLVTGAKCEF